MIHFAWPLVFLLLPAPFLTVRLFSGGYREVSAAVRVPFFAELKSISAVSGSVPLVRRRNLILWGMWFLLVTAAARPQVPDGIQAYTVPVRDILLVLDISRSMEHRDLADTQQSRLEAVKEAASSFIAMRKNDRLGIILFSEQANLYVPLTVDSKALQEMTAGIRSGLLGTLTAVGDALGLSLQYLEKSGAKHKTVILLTDGVSNAGNVAPLDALEAAKRAGVTVYTIGVGSPFTENGGVDVAFLRKTAAETGGLFFMVQEKGALNNAYRVISSSEPLSKAGVFLIPQKELYPYPLFLFMLIASAVVLKRTAAWVHYYRGRS